MIDTQFFPHFMRLMYEEAITIPNEDLLELGTEFKTYLEKRFEGKEDKLAAISDITPKTVIGHQVRHSVGYMKGYHPALVYHLGNFIEELAKQEQSTN